MKNTGFFHFSLADFGRARSRTGVFRTVFYSVFWRRASRPIKNRRFWTKNAPPPPPGKPVTFLRVPSGRSRPSTFGAGGFCAAHQFTALEAVRMIAFEGTQCQLHSVAYCSMTAAGTPNKLSNNGGEKKRRSQRKCILVCLHFVTFQIILPRSYA